MKKRHFDVETDGFYGAYWKCKTGSDCAMIAMIGDDPEDYLARTSVKWLHKLGVNVMTMSPGKKDYGHHNYPLERIEKAISWLKTHGNQKIGIVGASTTPPYLDVAHQSRSAADHQRVDPTGGAADAAGTGAAW